MPSIFVVGHMTTAGRDAREKIIAAITKVMQYAQSSEPGVLKYCITKPRDSSDEKTLYIIEEYADQGALDSHMACEAVAGIFSFFSTNPTLLAGAPDVWTMDSITAFTRQETARVDDPNIEIVTYSSKPEADVTALKSDSNALSFAVLKDKSAQDVWRTIAAYHGGRSQKPNTVSVQRVAGFFYKGVPTASL